MLEFPRRARVSPPAEPPTPSLPAWRLELNEKVRAIRANRSPSSTQVEALVEQTVRSFDSEVAIDGTAPLPEETRLSYGKDASLRASRSRLESNGPEASPATSTRRSSNNIVEAALIRVKRASENASRAALPKIEPARSVQASAQVPLAGDRQATARALAPAPEIETRVEYTPAARPEFIQPPITHSTRIEPSFPEKRRSETTAIADPIDPPASPVAETVERASVLVLDEIEPLDYLEAEVRKVDKALGAEFLRNESPSILTHGVIGVVDLFAVAISCSPFMAFIMIADGSFSIARTRLASGVIVAMMAFFYLALTQCLCGRTFGMMLTNTRVVDANTFEAPSPPQALLRTAGYFVAAAPAMAGILWAVFDQRHRGWQDFISRTVVVRDF